MGIYREAGVFPRLEVVDAPPLEQPAPRADRTVGGGGGGDSVWESGASSVRGLSRDGGGGAATPVRRQCLGLDLRGQPLAVVHAGIWSALASLASLSSPDGLSPAALGAAPGSAFRSMAAEGAAPGGEAALVVLSSAGGGGGRASPPVQAALKGLAPPLRARRVRLLGHDRGRAGTGARGVLAFVVAAGDLEGWQRGRHGG